MDEKLDEIGLVRSVSRESFFCFCQEFWSVIIKEKPVWNWHIEFLCAEIQIAAERVLVGQKKEYDLIINQPPATTKSTIISVLFPAWVWTREQSMRTIAGSHTYSLGMDLSRKCRDVIISPDRADGKPTYRECFPEVQLRGDQNTKEHFMNTRTGFRKSVTVGGTSPMGFHGHFLLVDDPLDPQQATSEADLKNANDWMAETLPSRKVDQQITLTILVMQRLHQNDPTGNWLERSKKNVKHISLPADAREYDVEPPELRHRYTDDLLDPVRLPRETLQEKRRILGEWAYAGQYGQAPVPRGGGMFKISQFKYGTWPTGLMRVCRYWDKAGTQGGGCYTVGALLGFTVNKWTKLREWWVLDIVRGQWESNEREAVILNTAKRDEITCGNLLTIAVEEEGGSGGVESASNTVRRLAGYRVIRDKPKGDKALRSDPYACQVNDGNVTLVVGPWNAEYLGELAYFPNSRYKDQADGSSGAFAVLNGPITTLGALW